MAILACRDRALEISDELVELACAAEQATTGLHKWPEGWTPAFADEYRVGMRAFLATIIPFIEAEIIAKAFNAARNDHSVASNDDTDQTQPNLNSGASSA